MNTSVRITNLRKLSPSSPFLNDFEEDEEDCDAVKSSKEVENGKKLSIKKDKNFAFLNKTL